MKSSDIEHVESWLGQRLPEPYRAFLSCTRSDFIAPNGRTLVYCYSSVVERNEAFASKEYCPGCVAVGDDSGGSAIILSLADGIIYRVDIGAMTPDCFEPVSPSFVEWIAAEFPHRTN